jgi:hypothetical protein
MVMLVGLAGASVRLCRSSPARKRQTGSGDWKACGCLVTAPARNEDVPAGTCDSTASGLYQAFVKWLAERGARLARLARREEGAYRRYVTDEQRRQAGCPARQALYKCLIQPTRWTCA